MIPNWIKKKSTFSFFYKLRSEKKTLKPNREDKIAILLGIDKTELQQSKGKMSDIEIEQAQTAYSEALKKTTDTLDLSYYFLGDKHDFFSTPFLNSYEREKKPTIGDCWQRSQKWRLFLLENCGCEEIS